MTSRLKSMLFRWFTLYPFWISILVWPAMLVSMNISVDIWVNFTVSRMIWTSSDFGILDTNVNHIEENISDSLSSVLFSNSSIGLFGLKNFILDICFIIENYIWPWKYSTIAMQCRLFWIQFVRGEWVRWASSQTFASGHYIYLFIYSIINVCSKCIKQKYSILSIYNCHHKHSVTRLHESEKELTTVQCI